LAGFGLAGTSVYADEPQAIVPEKHLDLMYDHCMDCHNADTQKGKVNLGGSSTGGKHPSTRRAMAKSTGCDEFRRDATGKQTTA
jgi:hypothetical protein